MKINTQGLLFTQPARNNTFNSFFNSFIKKPVSQERNWKQELHQKISGLTRKNNEPPGLSCLLSEKQKSL